MTHQTPFQTQLDAIVNDSQAEASARIVRILDLGRAQFGLNLGIVSHIVGESYVAEHVSPPESGLAPGTEFALPRTYCDLTYKFKRTLGIPDMSMSPYNAHPCYADFSLDAYFGTPLMTSDGIYGTINFTAKESRAVDFTDDEKQMIEMMGRAVVGLMGISPASA